MDSKIKLTICSGTVCYIMGGSELLLISDKLPPELKENVIIKGSPCLGLCKNIKNGKPPFVTVNDEIISEATSAKIITQLQKNMRVYN